MKLAAINSDGVAQCLICSWNWKSPSKRRKKNIVEDLTTEDKIKLLEQNILAHLRDVHDRFLLTRERLNSTEDGDIPKIYYNGRRPEKLRRWKKLYLR